MTSSRPGLPAIRGGRDRACGNARRCRMATLEVAGGGRGLRAHEFLRHAEARPGAGQRCRRAAQDGHGRTAASYRGFLSGPALRSPVVAGAALTGTSAGDQRRPGRGRKGRGRRRCGSCRGGGADRGQPSTEADAASTSARRSKVLATCGPQNRCEHGVSAGNAWMLFCPRLPRHDLLPWIPAGPGAILIVKHSSPEVARRSRHLRWTENPSKCSPHPCGASPMNKLLLRLVRP